MSRSIKKGPYVDEKLMIKINRQKAAGTKDPIKTWSRDSQIAPEFVGWTFLVHNGRKHLSVFINESMVGHRLGEFSPTRTFRGHGKVTQRSISKT